MTVSTVNVPGLPPNRNQAQPDFDTTAYTYLSDLNTALTEFNTAVGEFNTDVETVNTASADAVAAKNTAIAATNATEWVSEGSYSEFDVVWSPVDHLPYVAKTTHSGVATDPSSDSTNWQLFTGLSSEGFVMTGPITVLNFIETVHTLIGTALDPANGTVQVKTFSGTETLTDSIANGENIALRLVNGATHSPTLPSITWVGQGAPDLTDDDWLVLWKTGGVLYGRYVGAA